MKVLISDYFREIVEKAEKDFDGDLVAYFGNEVPEIIPKLFSDAKVYSTFCNETDEGAAQVAFGILLGRFLDVEN